VSICTTNRGFFSSSSSLRGRKERKYRGLIVLWNPFLSALQNPCATSAAGEYSCPGICHSLAKGVILSKGYSVQRPHRSFPSCSMHQKKIHYPNNLTFHDNHLVCLEVLYLYLFKFWDNKFHMVIRQRIIQSNSPKLSVSCLRQLNLRQPKLIFRRASQQFPPVSNISPLACNCDLCHIQSRNAKHQHWFNRSLKTRKTHTIASKISGK